MNEKHQQLMSEELYFMHPYEDCAVRTKPNGHGWELFVRFPGGVEYQPDAAGHLAADAVLSPFELITREQYYSL